MSKKIAFVILSLISTFLFAELVIRLFNGRELIFLRSSLYVQGADTDSHRFTSKVGRLYELKPSSSVTYTYGIHPKERKYQERVVSINHQGFRGKSNVEDVKTKVRVAFLGGSNTYGAAVTDEDTYPAQLETLMKNQYGDYFEFINAGISAYVISQLILYADDIIESYEPDFVFLDVSNGPGRRAFLSTDDNFTELLRENQELLQENIPLLLFNSTNDRFDEIHSSMVTHSVLYRLLTIVFNQFSVMYSVGNSNNFSQCSTNRCRSIDNGFSKISRKRTTREFASFLERHAEIPIIIFNEWGNCTLTRKSSKNVFYYDLCPEGLDDEYRHIHPPSYVYKWYAEKISADVFHSPSLHGVLMRKLETSRATLTF